MKATLYLQKPKAKKKGIQVEVDVDRQGRASAFDLVTSRVIASMKETRLLSIPADGVLLSGFEFQGVGSDGLEKYLYQEWWLRLNRD